MKRLVQLVIALSLALVGCDGAKPIATPPAAVTKSAAPTAPAVSVPPLAGAAPDIKFTNWLPQSHAAGTPFNLQPDGSYSIIFYMAGAIENESMEAWFGDKKAVSLAIKSDHGGSVQIHPSQVEKAGSFPVYLLHTKTGKRYDIGTFVVTAK